MKPFKRELGETTERDLHSVIEPLAGYICATDEPETALALALDILLSELRLTNRAARERVATLSKNLTVFGGRTNACYGGRERYPAMSAA